jgi:hypothetical protein
MIRDLHKKRFSQAVIHATKWLVLPTVPKKESVDAVRRKQGDHGSYLRSRQKWHVGRKQFPLKRRV